MAMFDSIKSETSERFGLGEKAGALLSALLALMTDGNRGGLTGFAGKFNQADFGDAASSWISSGVNADLSNEQLEAALGTDTLKVISNQIETDYTTTVSAAAFMIPRIVNALTPDGVVPPDSDLLTKIGGYLTTESAATTAETFDRVGTAAAAPNLEKERKNVTDANVIDKVSPSIDDKMTDSTASIGNTYSDNNNSPLGWLLPLLLLGLLLVLGYLFCSKPQTTSDNTSQVIQG
jgi:uncharacterized protein YidB (DUF937 family)